MLFIITGEAKWGKNRHLYTVSICCPSFLQDTWALNLPDLLISYSISRHNLVVQPHDINMQILVDNNAKPHNQQIINSPWLPRAHASSTCGKKLLMHAAKHQTSSMLWSLWLITVSKRPDMLTHIWFNLLRSLWKYGLAFRNMSDAFTELETWRDIVGKINWHECSIAIPAYKEETRTGVVCPFLTTGISFGTMEKLMHWKGVLCCS